MNSLNSHEYYSSNKKDKFQKSSHSKTSNTSSSTLSLHIAAYENSSEASNNSNIGEEVRDSKKTKNYASSKLLQNRNSFEFPRQQKEENSKPEIAQFKASQKLLNPNEPTSSTSTSSSDAAAVAADSSTNSVRENSRDNNPQLLLGGTGQSYSVEELKLLIIKYINDNLTIHDLLQHLGDIGKQPCKLVQTTFEDELCKFVKSGIKNLMTELVANGNTEFIEEAETNMSMNSKFFTFWAKKLTDNGIQLADITWMDELYKFYGILESRLKLYDADTALKNAIFEWLESGEMSQENWNKWRSWFLKGVNLQTLKDVQWIDDANDSLKPKFIKALRAMTLDNFSKKKKEEFFERLKLYLEEPLIEIDKSQTEIKTINVIGRTVFLSSVKAKIERLMGREEIEQVDIIANNTLHIDVSLDGEIWVGKNLTVVTDKINVWNEQVIDVSGKGFAPSDQIKKAQDGKDGKNTMDSKGEDGKDGEDGEAGESSGNITIITEQMINPESLTLIVNGGNGEDGESGGKGGDGKDGIGVTKKELNSIALKYRSLYFDYWSFFKDYFPPGWTKTKDLENKEKKYIEYEFKNADGRELYYTFGADEGWPDTYELVIWMKGTKGTEGGIGGKNGKGGEGGKSGECNIFKPSTETQYSIKVLQSNGKPGKDGEVGKCGKSGNNGNDMALIDRSETRPNKFYIGGEGNKQLKMEFKSERGKKRRINRRLQVDGEPKCFMDFEESDIQPGGLVSQQHQKNEERSNKAKATMKKSIILNKVLEKAQNIRSQMNSELKFDASKNLKLKLNVDEEVEEEETAEQQQEVVIVKNVNEEELDVGIKKPRKCNVSPAEFAKNVPQKQGGEDLQRMAEILNDYFSIEFDAETLDTIQNVMLPRCQNFVKQFNFNSKELDEATKAEFQTLADKASTEISTNVKTMTTNFRSKVSELPKFIQTSKLSINKDLVQTKDHKLQSVKFYAYPEKIPEEFEKLVRNFFMGFCSYNIGFDLLLPIFEAYTALNFEFPTLFGCFETYEIKFGDKESWENTKKTIIESDPNVQKVIQTICKNSEWLKTNFASLKKLINGSGVKDKMTNKIIESELQGQMGKVPDFHKDESKNLEAAQYLIRFNFQMKALTEFNRQLMIINLLHRGQQNNANLKAMKSYSNLDVKSLLKRISTMGIKSLDADECQNFMREKGFQSAAFKYLISQKQNLEIEIYGNEKYGTVELIDSWPGENLIRLYLDGTSYFTIDPDLELRNLIEARATDKWDTEFSENLKRLKDLPWKYGFEEDKTKSKTQKTLINKKSQFAEYFLSSFSQNVFEWIDCYLAATKNDNLIKLLHQRFEYDGNHLEITDFQFILSTAILLQNSFQVSPNFIVNFASAIPQSKLVDQFFILRLESLWRRQLQSTPALLESLEKIPNKKLKILLATKIETKLAENDEENDKILGKLLAMLRHTSSNNNQLEKMSLDEWKSVAEKQQFFEISEAVRNLESIGYYIVSLRQKGRLEAADKLEKFLTKPNKEYHIPQKLIAQICTLIIYDEIVFDEAYLQHLDKLLSEITSKSKVSKTGKHVFITNECDQIELLQQVQDTEAYKNVFTEKPRNLEVIADLIKDNDKNNPRKIVRLIRDKDNELTKILNQYDEKVRKLRGFPLRGTQKMAIMYAVTSEKNILSQINTGEGKSLIVAGIAIIQALRPGSEYKHIDVITSTSVLAQRDADEMRNLFEAMNLTVDHNCHDDMENRKQAYKAKIVYGEISRFQRDSLLHDYYQMNILGDRNRGESCVVVDEVDNMLYDNGNNVLYLSHTVRGMHLLEPQIVHLVRIICAPTINGDKEKAFETDVIESKILSNLLGRFSKEDLEWTAKNDSTSENACFAVWNYLVDQQIIDSDGYLLIQNIVELGKRQTSISESLQKLTTSMHSEKILTCLKAVINRRREISIPQYLIPFLRRHLNEYIENAKRALFMKQNDAYVVDVDHTAQDSDITPKITIIDKNTGADLATSQWSEALHQCLQAKHGCRMNPISMKAVFISNVTYLQEYARINGLSGTLGSEEESKTLVAFYNAKLIKIPTFKAKRFYEHVPIIVKTEEEWLDSIFESVTDKIEADRSVLIICRSIAEARKVKSGLEARYSEEECSPKVQRIFDDKTSNKNFVIYEREFDEFDFGGENALKSCCLLIATNLAGRGTDIKLHSDLRKAGGLFTLFSFLPENSRIEDQGYGRAARCGDPGSGQIIAMQDDQNDSGKALSIFDLKSFRDNAEVQRLKAMQDYYEYRTEVEEKCLKAFKEHSLKALKEMKRHDQNEGVPTEESIIYFALLDEWALWLDSQTSAIKQCAKDCCPVQKANIIASVETFLNAHPIFPSSQALKWINCPNALLDLGLNKIGRNQMQEAEQIFDQVSQKFPEFTGYASYYKGVIAQRNVRKIKEVPKTDENTGFFQKIANKVMGKVVKICEETLTSMKDFLPDEICEINEDAKIKAEDNLLQAIGTFNLRSELKQESSTIVSRLQEGAGPQIVTSSGFKNQCAETKNVYDCLSTSAYDMIGHPISFATIAKDSQTIEEKFKAQQKFEEFKRLHYITERILNNQISEYQYEKIQQKHMLSKMELQKIIIKLSKDNKRLDESEVMEKIMKKIKMPSREEFWKFLESYGCFKEVQEFYALQNSLQNGEIDELKNLMPIQLSVPVPGSFQLQLSDMELSKMNLYDATKVEQAFGKNKEKKKKLEWLDSNNFLVKDAVAIVDEEKLSKNCLPLARFEYFIIEDLAEWLGITVDDAIWIAEELCQRGTLRCDRKTLEKINRETSTNQINSPGNLNLPKEIYEKYKEVIESKDLRKLDNLSMEVLKGFLKLSSEEAQAYYRELKEYEIIIEYAKDTYFQNIDDLKCSTLPECIQSSVEAFLKCKFAYTFARETILKTPSNKKPHIALPWKPHKQLFEDLIKFGLLHDHRFDLQYKDCFDKIDLQGMDEIEKQFKPRLFIKKGSLISTKQYFKDEQVDASMDVRMQAIDSMKQFGKIGENYWWIFWMIVKIAFTLFTSWSIPGMIMLGLDIAMNFDSYFSTALLVVAAVGTMLYFYQMVTATYTSQTGREASEERFTQLVEFHSKTIEYKNKHKREVQLTNVITTSITTKVKNVLCFNFAEIYSSLIAEAKVTKMGERKFQRLAIAGLKQPRNWRILNDAIRDILVRIRVKVAAEYFKILDECKSPEGIDNEEAMKQCHNLNKTLKVTINGTDKKLLTTLAVKIIEDCVFALQESNEIGEDSEEEKIPEDFYDIDLNDNSDLESIDEETQTNLSMFEKEFMEQIQHACNKGIETQITKPLSSLFSGYIEDSNLNKDVPNGFKEYLNENSGDKLSIETRKKETLAFQARSFIILDLQKVVRQSYENVQSKRLLYEMIKYGHALSKTAMKGIIDSLFQILKEHNPGLEGIKVLLRSDGQDLVFESSYNVFDKKAKTCAITVTLSHGHFYICQNDSRKLLKNQKDGDYIEACLFESMAKHNPEAAEISKRGAEAFRTSILQLISPDFPKLKKENEKKIKGSKRSAFNRSKI